MPFLFKRRAATTRAGRRHILDDLLKRQGGKTPETRLGLENQGVDIGDGGALGGRPLEHVAQALQAAPIAFISLPKGMAWSVRASSRARRAAFSHPQRVLKISFSKGQRA